MGANQSSTTTSTNTLRQEVYKQPSTGYPQPAPQQMNQKYEIVPNSNINPQYSRGNTMNQNYNYPQQNIIPQILRPKYKGIITMNMLKDGFRTFAIEGKYLNKDRFNDTIESIFKFDIPEIHYTYLTDKIYEILDESGDGKIQDDEFYSGISKALTDREFRIFLSMQAMMTRLDKNRTSLEVSEISDFFYKSWVQGFKHLGWQVKREKNDFLSKNIPAPSITQFELWSSKFESHCKVYIQSDLKENGIDVNKAMDFETFKKWISLDHTLYITYAHKTIKIATSLLCLDDIGFDNSSNTTSSNPMGSVPSFQPNVNVNINVNPNNANVPSNQAFAYPSFK